MLRYNVLPVREGTRVAQVHLDYPAGEKLGNLCMPYASCGRCAAGDSCHQVVRSSLMVCCACPCTPPPGTCQTTRPTSAARSLAWRLELHKAPVFDARQRTVPTAYQ